MANYTQTQLDALRDALARGVRKVEYNGESVTYQSVSEMERVIARLERDLAGSKPTRTVYGTSRGLR